MDKEDVYTTIYQRPHITIIPVCPICDCTLTELPDDEYYCPYCEKNLREILGVEET